jgi:hypothetical protein
MLKSFSVDTAHAAESWAEVRARDQVMRYRRVGVGRSVVLLLRSCEPAEPLWRELLEALSVDFRLIVPEQPAPGADVAGWLAGFLEGLGMSNVAVLAADRFCLPAVELALVQGDQLARIVLVPDGADASGRGPCCGKLETALGQAALPLLVVHRGHPASEIVPLVTGFLRGKEA